MDQDRETSRSLTAREEQIASLIAAGCTNGEIAERLGIGFSTAKWHVSEIISKLGVSSREEVAARWKQERSFGRRLRRVPAGLIGGFSLKPVTALLAGTVLSVASGAFVIALASRGDGSIADEDLASAPLVQEVTATVPTQDAAGYVRLTDLDGDPSKGYLAGSLESGDLHLRQHDGSGGGIGDSRISAFRDWELFIAAASTRDGVGGLIAVAGSERVARIDLVVPSTPRSPFTPDAAPPALGYPLRVIYVTVPPGQVWQFLAYDAAGNFIGTVGYGSGVGAGQSYVERGSPDSAPPASSASGPDQLDALSNGHVTGIWPLATARVSQEETAAPRSNPPRTGVCADVTESGRAPGVRLADFQFLVNNRDVTAELTRYYDGDPQTATSGTLCYAPAGGLAPGSYNVAVMVHARADRTGGYLGIARWQFVVVAR